MKYLKAFALLAVVATFIVTVELWRMLLLGVKALKR